MVCSAYQDGRWRTPEALAVRQFLDRQEDGDWGCAIMLMEFFPVRVHSQG